MYVRCTACSPVIHGKIAPSSTPRLPTRSTRDATSAWPMARNMTCTDMYIESTFMGYGHSPGGIIGITLKYSTVKRWELSLHLCSQIVSDVSEMKDESRKVSVNVHKEKMPARNQSDAAGRETLRERLKACIEPLNPDDHPNHLVRFVCAGS